MRRRSGACPKSQMTLPLATQACESPKATPELCEPLVTAAQTMLADALAAKLEVVPRKDVYVKGAQDWEKNCWKVR